MDAFNDPELLITADGSTTLYHSALNETYHSKHGAIQESKHVFIKNGLQYFTEQNRNKKDISILEVGLGTGLNAFLTFIEAENTDIHISFTALEAFPPPYEIIEKLNYAGQLQAEQFESIFLQLHICDWNKMHTLSKNFSFLKTQTGLEEFSPETKFDIIYFDAFAPQIQPELWTEEIFKNLYNYLNKNALLVTYCAKGQVRRNMQTAGFLVQRLAGPPGKREILRALKL